MKQVEEFTVLADEFIFATLEMCERQHLPPLRSLIVHTTTEALVVSLCEKGDTPKDNHRCEIRKIVEQRLRIWHPDYTS